MPALTPLTFLWPADGPPSDLPAGVECVGSAAFARPEVEALNRGWRQASGSWILFATPGLPLPREVPLEGDLVAPGPRRSPWELRRPFAIRRAWLEALGGLRELPDGCAFLDLGWRALAFGARVSWVADWVPRSEEPQTGPLQRDTALALLHHHPSRAALQWICDQSDGEQCPEAALEAVFEDRYGRPPCSLGSQTPGALAEAFARRADPPLVEETALRETLTQVAHRGEVIGLVPGCLDPTYALNWLRTRTPWYEAEQRRNLLLRHPTPLLLGAGTASWGVEVEGTWEVEVSAAAMAGLKAPTLLLPMPVLTPDQEILSRTVEGVGEEEGRVRLPLVPEADGRGRATLGFRCRVREGRCRPEAGAPERPRPTRLAPGLETRLNALLEDVFPEGPGALEPRGRAHRIYAWILDHVPYLHSDHLGPFALVALAGNCGHQVRLFELMAERVGLPVRLRSGALAGDIGATGEGDQGRWVCTRQEHRGHPVVHQWAEVHLGDEGWCPVDFMTSAMAARGLTPGNAVDPAVRGWLEDWSPRLDAYAFGHLDPYRVHFGPPPRHASGLPTGFQDTSLERLRWLAWQTRFGLRLRFTGLPPEDLRAPATALERPWGDASWGLGGVGWTQPGG